MKVKILDCLICDNKLVNVRLKQQNEKKNYVIEFNKNDLKPHSIWEKEDNFDKNNNKLIFNSNYDDSNLRINKNNDNNQDIVSESNNFYYNEGKIKDNK
jgi:hypothetical protein